MKFVKLSVLALSLGLFVASCGSGGGENKTNDSTANAATAAPATTAPAAPAAPADTMTAAPAKPADSAKAAAPEAKKDETKK